MLTISAEAFKIETDMEAALLVIFILLGMVVASFLNVCGDRLPAGESIVSTPSHCPACRRRLGARDLVPVFSYLWLRGRCRYCRAPIPRRVLWVEVGTGLLFGLLYWNYGLSLELPIALFYSCLFIVILVIDLEHRLILNKIVYPAMGVALLLSILFSIPGFLPPTEIVPGIAQAAIGGGIGLVLFFLVVFFSRGGMGWGDVKMAALIGLVTGFPLVFVALLMAVIVGGLVAGLLLALKIKKRRQAIPFGPFLSLATIVTLVWGSDILGWYLGFFG
jgi:leader peptidase (prepilin peptidase)/N-methyltransferase